jgi:hypothetical protein
MLRSGDKVDNRTICDLFGVANMGGIRVCTARNLIVLISNKPDPLYRNEWKDAGEPYMSDQVDARADSRLVWIFPLRRKPVKESADAAVDEPREPVAMNHFPHGAYAVVASYLRDDQIELVNKLLDQLKEAGVASWTLIIMITSGASRPSRVNLPRPKCRG